LVVWPITGSTIAGEFQPVFDLAGEAMFLRDFMNKSVAISGVTAPPASGIFRSAQSAA